MSVIHQYKVKNVLSYVILGLLAGTAVGFFLQYIDREGSFLPVIRGAIIGLLVGTTIGVGEEFFFLDKFRRKSHLFLQLFRGIVYSAAFVFYELLVHTVINFLSWDLTVGESIATAFYRVNFLRDLIIIAFISLAFIFFLQVRRLHNPGDLGKFVFGKYHVPEEICKIFLFIDLKSSTATAEKLGNLQYSSFLIDYYHDMTNGILMSKAEIYQYVGDEIILTWSLEDGIKYARCINCFFDIRNTMELNKDKYMQQYGVYPQFKAALHAGKVSVTWIGGIKKEIVYHGDVINTTARIQMECNKYKQSLLISEYLLKKMELPGYLRSEYMAELQLKGRQEKIKVFGLKYITEE